MELTVNGITKSFGEKRALDGVSFTARSGSPLGLLGRNGAGKTTSMRIIMDIFRPDGGEVLLDGIPVADVRARSLAQFGYLPEERGLYRKMTVSEQLVYFARLKGMTRADAQTAVARWLERLDMGETAKQNVETLSKGNQQRIQLALALINDPGVVILDEPFSGLDPVNAMQLREIVGEVAAKGSLVIFSSHQMSAVEDFCDDIVILRDGRVAIDGSLRSIRAGYPRDRIRVTAEKDAQAKSLAAAFGEVTDARDGFIVTLRNVSEREKLLMSLAGGGVGVTSFETVEPTLEEIFVAAVGEGGEDAS